MASTILTKPPTRADWAAGRRWRLAGQHRTGIHCSIATNGVMDAHQEAVHAADTSTDDIALRRRCGDAGDFAGTGHLAQHGTRVSGADRRGRDWLAADAAGDGCAACRQVCWRA